MFVFKFCFKIVPILTKVSISFCQTKKTNDPMEKSCVNFVTMWLQHGGDVDVGMGMWG